MSKPQSRFSQIFVRELVNLSIYVSNQIIAPAPRVPRNSHASRICRVSWKYRDKPRWIKKFRNTRNNVTIISCHRVFYADWLAQFKKEMITKQTCFFFSKEKFRLTYLQMFFNVFTIVSARVKSFQHCPEVISWHLGAAEKRHVTACIRMCYWTGCGL